MFSKILKFLILSTISINIFAQVCTRELVMGWDDYTPYQFEATAGKSDSLTGYDVDLAKAVLTKMGCKVRFVKLPWARHLEELKAGRVDLGSSASINAERQVYGFFTESYFPESGMALFVRKGDTAKFPFKKLADVNAVAFKLGTIQGYDYGDEFEKLKDTDPFKTHLQVSDNLAQNVKKLDSNRIDGVLEDPFVFNSAIKELNLVGKFEKNSMALSVSPIYFIVSKASLTKEFVTEFNKVLAEFKDNGEYKAITDKYLN